MPIKFGDLRLYGIIWRTILSAQVNDPFSIGYGPNYFSPKHFFPFKFLLLANKISNASAEVKVMLTIAFNLDLIAVEIALSRSSQCHNWAKEFGWLKRMDTIRSVELCTLCVNSWIKEWIARTWTFLRLFIYNFCFM